MNHRFMQKRYLYLIVFLCNFSSLSFLLAQSDSMANKVKYTPDFKFKEGIYLNFEQVKENSPIPKSRIVTSVDYRSKTFFDEVLEATTITYFDDLGNSQQLNTSQLWGYCKNGFIYILMGGHFNRITIIGNVCHFVATITSYTNRYNSPYSYGYSPYGYYPYGYYSPYDYSYGSPTYRTTETRQFLLNFNTGKVMEYDNKNVEAVLMSDPELYDEYASLRSKKQQQLRFMYIRKYNEKHPLYVPK